jgi:hypothetical protein
MANENLADSDPEEQQRKALEQRQAQAQAQAKATQGPGTTIQQPNTATVVATKPEPTPEETITKTDRKYMEDVRTVNNLQVDDPMKFQQEHGYYPRRGDLNADVEIAGLSKQDRIDVVAGRKSLEQSDDKGRQFKVVDRKMPDVEKTQEQGAKAEAAAAQAQGNPPPPSQPQA